jgi:hypothetical protein
MIHVSLSLLIILVGTVRVSPPETLTMVPERLRRACKIKIRAAAIRVDYLLTAIPTHVVQICDSIELILIVWKER